MATAPKISVQCECASMLVTQPDTSNEPLGLQAYLDKVSMKNQLLHVGCQKRFPMYRANSMYQVADFGRGSAYHKDLEQVPIDWARNFPLQIQNRHIIHSSLQLLYLWSELLYCSVTFLSIHSWRIRQFASPELSSILPLHGYFRCEFLEMLFLVEPILREFGPALFERFFIPTIYAIRIQTMRMSLSLKYTNASVKSINFTFLLQDFRFCFCEWMISLFFKNQHHSFFQIREPDERFTFSLNRLMS